MVNSLIYNLPPPNTPNDNENASTSRVSSILASKYSVAPLGNVPFTVPSKNTVSAFKYKTSPSSIVGINLFNTAEISLTL